MAANDKPTNLVVIMPCKNEADNLAIVVKKLKALKPVEIVVGLDPGTTDNTRTVALQSGCIVINAERSGYDAAVYAATNYALESHNDSLLLYTDAGNKYSYGGFARMISMANDGSDMVIGVRKDTGNTMLWHQKLGTKLILSLIILFTGQKLQDISPFRLVKSSVFDVVTMEPRRFRWPSELLIKSLACGLKVGQVEVVALPRQGTSKVSGSILNSARAGLEMFSSLRFLNYKKGAEHVTEHR